MTDRKQAIATLTEHLNHWKRLLSEGICCEVEGKQTIDALEFAIESIKVDRAYGLAYEKVGQYPNEWFKLKESEDKE